ncbi:hypothetical protein J2853_002901 [Streptosporangium lutulentum]|uniref:Mutator family transposase n=1 Tax=Streptosporangium lutulentum TaxID=1461250 RepID=A0ABT9QAA3_9ACTN|nr:hypothetical protein [Streptosporangium lutulentum]
MTDAPTSVGKAHPLLTVVPDSNGGDRRPADSSSSSLIDEIVREGARRMPAEALKAEVDAYLAQFADERDEHGRRPVVRNGSHQPREILTAVGAIDVTAPRVNDKRIGPDTGERQRFSSAILPPWARKTPQITEVLPLLYRYGLSVPAFLCGCVLGDGGFLSYVAFSSSSLNALLLGSGLEGVLTRKRILRNGVQQLPVNSVHHRRCW